LAQAIPGPSDPFYQVLNFSLDRFSEMASKWTKSIMFASVFGSSSSTPIPSAVDVQKACYSKSGPAPECATVLAAAVVGHSEQCFYGAATQSKYNLCCHSFCAEQCSKNEACADLCYEKSSNLYAKLQHAESQLAALKNQSSTSKPAAQQVVAPKTTVLKKTEAPPVPKNWDSIDQYVPPEKDAKPSNVATVGKKDIQMKRVSPAPEKKKGPPLPLDGQETLDAVSEEDLKGHQSPKPRTIQMHAKPLSFMSKGSVIHKASAPEDDLAKEMTHDLEMNFNKIAPFGKEDTAKELQDHAAKTQDTLVDAVENAEVAEIKRAVFRALTRLRAATIKEFDTIARLETQAIDAYNDAHHYRAENPLTHLHEDEAPVETDKLKSFH